MSASCEAVHNTRAHGADSSWNKICLINGIGVASYTMYHGNVTATAMEHLHEADSCLYV